MAKTTFDPWSLPRPEYPVQEWTVTDERAPETPLTFRMRKLDPLQMASSQQDAQKLISEYVRPDEDEEGDYVPFTGPDGQSYELNESIIRDICMLKAMDQDEKTFIWWVGFIMRMPSAYAQLTQRVARIQAGYDLGNRKAARRTSILEPSAPPSPSPAVIPN